MSVKEEKTREAAGGERGPLSRLLVVRERAEPRRKVGLHALEWPSSASRTILLLHGGAAHAHWWDHVAPRFTATHRVFALDFRGHGDSEHTAGRYGAEVLADDVEQVIDAVGGSADVVGASMGGVVGLRAAARGARIRRLVVVDSPPEPPPDVAARRAVLARSRRYASREEGLRRFRLMPPETLASPRVLQHVAEHSLRPTGDGGWTLKHDPGMFAANPPPSLYEILPRVGCPTLYLRGERSAVVTKELAARVAALIPNARMATIADAYHHLFLDKPDVFVAEVRAFLDAREDR